jgi:sulfite oxidase
MEKLDRRTTLKLMGMGAALLAAGSRALAQQTPTADQLVKGKNPKLIVLSQRPVVLETPYDLLVSQPERTPRRSSSSATTWTSPATTRWKGPAWTGGRWR